MTVLLQNSRLALADRLADTGLWLLAAINVLVAVSFLIVLATLSPANAQEPPAMPPNACRIFTATRAN